ncbi:MAG: hypothetical protein ACI8ZW_002376, partial [Yoonia sp.]
AIRMPSRTPARRKGQTIKDMTHDNYYGAKKVPTRISETGT